MSILTKNPEPIVSRETSALNTSEPSKPQLEMIRLDQIVPNPYQPRKVFSESELLELGNDIYENGLLQPINVRLSRAKWWIEKGRSSGKEAWFVRNENWFKGTGPCASTYEQPDGAPPYVFDSKALAEATLPRYELVAGERRVRASRLTPIRALPAIIVNIDDQSMAERALAENALRKDVSILEEARAMKRLSVEFGQSQQQIADRCGMSRPRVSNRMRLLELPQPVVSLLESGALSESHCVTLAGLLPLGERFVELYAHRIVEMGYSSKEIEKALMISWDFGKKLAEQKIALMCDRYQTAFDLEIACEMHPNVFRKTAPMNGYGVQTYCFSFEMYDHLQIQAREAQEAAERERKAEIERLVASGQKVIPLETLSSSKDYDRLDYWEPPKTCTGACPCRATGVKSDGTQVPICLDPARLKGLRSAETRSQNKAKKEILTTQVKAIANEIDLRTQLAREGDPSLFTDLVAIVVLPFLTNAGKDILQQAVERRGLAEEINVETFISGISTTEGRLVTLSMLPLEDLLGLAAECKMHRAAAEYANGGYTKPLDVEWFQSRRLGSE